MKNSRPNPRRQWLLAGTCFVLFCIAVLFNPSHQPADLVWAAEDAVLIDDDIAQLRLPTFTNFSGTRVHLDQYRASNGVAWLRVQVPMDRLTLPHYPLALQLSGPFSAEVYWDGELIGKKGIPGTEASLEQPGPIDSIFHIPDGWTDPIEHLLALRLSSEHLAYQASTLVHSIQLMGFRSDTRRELRHYAWPLVLAGGLVILCVTFLRRYVQEKQSLDCLFALMALFVLLQLLAEVSRSLVSYPYQWHWLRLATIWTMALGWGVCWQLTMCQRLPARLAKLLVPAVVMVSLAMSFFVPGFDNKTLSIIYCLSTASLLVSAWELCCRRDLAVNLIDASFSLALLATLFVDPSTVLDQRIFSLASLYLALQLYHQLMSKAAPGENESSSRGPKYFVVRTAGKEVRVAMEQVAYLRADGNHTEIVCRDGSGHLHSDRLGTIMETAPANFIRVHRSYAVNMDCLAGLQARSGSRYVANLGTSHTVPVGRSQVAMLREKLSGH